MLRLALFTASLVLVACGGDDGPPTMVGRVDAPIDVAKPCTATAAYGTPTPMFEVATRDADPNPTEIIYTATINTDALMDDLSIELFDMLGAFTTGGITPQTIVLQADEANYETCGGCVLIYTDYDESTEAYDSTYMATGGTLNLTGVSPNITGTLINVNLLHVTIDEDTFRSTPVGDCASTITSFTFDFPVMTHTPAFTGSAKQKHLRKPGRR